MTLDEILQLHALRLKAGFDNAKLVDAMLEGQEVPGVRQMCAKVPAEMVDDLTQICELMQMSKRQFIEAAVGEALHRAHQVLESTGALKRYEGA